MLEYISFISDILYIDFSFPITTSVRSFSHPGNLQGFTIITFQTLKTIGAVNKMKQRRRRSRVTAASAVNSSDIQDILHEKYVLAREFDDPWFNPDSI